MTRVPVPADLVDDVQIAGLNKQIRIWGNRLPDNFDALVAQKVNQTKAHRPALLKRGSGAKISYLAISGGGSDGAYGAGVLVGWSAQGSRPEFDIVTGISTGALTAPFAFLGSAYDDKLRDIYTRYDTKQLLSPQFLSGLLGGSALVDDSKLAQLVARYVDRSMLDAIAREHLRGRRLLIGTTNLDAQRAVTWNMGALAQVKGQKALNLFRRILLASASIPGLFPPVMVEVEADGNTFQEMHVDGGTTNQVFFLPSQLMSASFKERLKSGPRRELYIIRNGKLVPEFEPVKSTTLSIASRSISTLIKTQGMGDLNRLYNDAQKTKMGYHLAVIPPHFNKVSEEPFDPVYMKALFELGYAQAINGYPWGDQSGVCAVRHKLNVKSIKRALTSVVFLFMR